jgi:phosphate starvation-inducible PhoH-like protein
MSRKRKPSGQVGISTTFKNRKKPQLITLDHMVELQPLTPNQERLFDSYDEGKCIVAHGQAGSGKTLCALYKALEDVLDPTTPYAKVIVVRSIVPTRDIGFLKGSIDEKQSEYEKPYKYMIKRLFNLNSDEEYELLYANLKAQNTFYFMSTSFIRGMTFDDCIIVVDEFSNLNGHELDSIITRVGENSRICFCGDATQSDLVKTSERNGIIDFMNIIRKMPSFDIIEFGINDIVRSSLVKEYLLAKYELGITL